MTSVGDHERVINPVCSWSLLGGAIVLILAARVALAGSKGKNDMAKRSTFKGVITPLMTPDQFEAVKALADDQEAASELVGSVLRAKHTVSVKWDEPTGSFKGTLSATVKGSNEGWYLTVFASTPERALVAVAYAHKVLARSGDWADTLLQVKQVV